MHSRITFALLALAVRAALAAETGSVEGKIERLGRGPFLVYVEKVPGTFPAALAVMNQRHNTYLPHILPVLVGSKVEFRSEDPELHNVYAWVTALKKVLFNVAIVPKTPPRQEAFDKEGVVRLTCNVHKEMLAWVIVLQNPFFQLSEKTEFRIEGLPPGKYALRIWGEKLEGEVLAKRFPFEVAAGGSASLTVEGGES